MLIHNCPLPPNPHQRLPTLAPPAPPAAIVASLLQVCLSPEASPARRLMELNETGGVEACESASAVTVLMGLGER